MGSRGQRYCVTKQEQYSLIRRTKAEKMILHYHTTCALIRGSLLLPEDDRSTVRMVRPVYGCLTVSVSLKEGLTCKDHPSTDIHIKTFRQTDTINISHTSGHCMNVIEISLIQFIIPLSEVHPIMSLYLYCICKQSPLLVAQMFT